MITDRTELTRHGLRNLEPPPLLLQQHRERARRELFTSARFRDWCKTDLQTLRSTQYRTHENPRVEVTTILGRFAAGARLDVEPDETRSGDIKRLHPLENGIWELKTGDVRVFGWFHAHDCFVAHSGDDATYTKVNGLYRHHIDVALQFLSESGLAALAGDQHHVLTC